MPKRTYEIRVEGLLGDNWMSWYKDLTIHLLPNGQTLLIGCMDQAMLRGILTTISDMGLHLVGVKNLEDDTQENTI